MISFNATRNIKSHDGSKQYIEGHCLSTDTKPTEGIVNGSTLLEMDTGKVYMFDEENKEWKEF